MTPKKGTKKTIKAVVPSRRTGLARVSVDALAAISEESVWLESRKSARTRRAYRTDVAHFIRTFDIRTPEELRKIDHRVVMAWERLMREEEGKEATTVRRRLAALSSLFAHLVKFGVVEVNPVRDVERPAVNRGILAEAGAADFGCAEGRHHTRASRSRNLVRRVTGRIPESRDREPQGR
jgi:hypothetical protein